MHRYPLSIAAAIALTVIFAGCEQQPPAAPASNGNTATKPSADELANVRAFSQQEATRQMPTSPQMPAGHAAVPPQLPPGHPPIEGSAGPAAGGTADGPSGTLKWTVPDAWVETPPSGQMRMAQYKLPKADGDAEDGELAVFFLSGPAGGIDGNIARWEKQFSKDGQPVPTEAITRGDVEVGPLKVATVSVVGQYNAIAMNFGGDAPAPKDNYRMLGALCMTSDGLWAFKAVGPKATMDAQEEAFNAMVKSMHVE